MAMKLPFLLLSVRIFLDPGIVISQNLPKPDFEHDIETAVEPHRFRLSVYVPLNYDSTRKPYPVVFALDGDASFDELVTKYCVEAKVEAIVVGIGYGLSQRQRRSYRIRDLTPDENQDLPESGGGTQFLEILKNDILPFVESRYHTRKGGRILAGHSLGGLFTLWVALTETKLFGGYIAISPSLSVSDIGSSWHQTGTVGATPIKLYISVGAKEDSTGMLNPFNQFKDLLRSQTTDGLEVMWKTNLDADHFTNVFASLPEAVTFVCH